MKMIFNSQILNQRKGLIGKFKLRRNLI